MSEFVVTTMFVASASYDYAPFKETSLVHHVNNSSIMLSARTKLEFNSLTSPSGAIT